MELESLDFAKECGAEWEVLERSVRPPAPYLQPKYLSLWLKRLGGVSRPRVITVWQDDRLMGYAPFMEAPSSVSSLFLPSLKFIGNNLWPPGDILYADIVASEPREEVIRAVLAHMRETMLFHRLDLGFVRLNSLLCDLFLKHLGRGHRMDPGLLRTFPYPRVELPSAWKSFLQSLSSNTRANFRRRLRQLQRTADVNLRAYRKPAEVRQGLREMHDDYDKWWGGTPREAWLGNDRVRQFNIEAAQLLSGQGRYLVVSLELGGEPIAWKAGILHGSRFFDERSSYNPEWSPLSPGFVLQMLLIQRMVRLGVATVELGPGTNDLKTSIATSHPSYVHIHGYPWTPHWVRRRPAFRSLTRSAEAFAEGLRAAGNV